jgi:hypothetical protein
MAQDMHPETEAAGHSTPLRAARQHCLSCCDGSSNEVRLCAASACSLWPYRFGKRPTAEDKLAVAGLPVYPLERKLTGASGLKAIRKRCVDCSGANDAEVRSCQYGPNHSTPCSLHAFRAGTNPFLAPRSVEWQQAAAERLAALKRPSSPKSPSQNPMSASAQLLEGEQPLGQAPV